MNTNVNVNAEQRFEEKLEELSDNIYELQLIVEEVYGNDSDKADTIFNIQELINSL